MVQSFFARTALSLVLGAAILLAACTSGDDIANPSSATTLASATTTTLSLGGVNLSIDAASIGGNADQLPLDSRVTITRVDDAAGLSTVQALQNGAVAVSPTYRIAVVDTAGANVANTNVSAGHRVTLTPRRAQLAALGLAVTDLVFVKVSGDGTALGMTYDTTQTINSKFTLDADGNPTALVSSFSDFLLIGGSAPIVIIPPPPTPTALSGTLAVNTGVANYNLHNSAETEVVTITMADLLLSTLTSPITIAPTNFDAQNPFDPTNRIFSLAVGGETFTSLNAPASVTLTLTSRSGVVSAGKITGSAYNTSGIEHKLNYTFVTEEAVVIVAPTLAIELANFPIDVTATNAAATAAVFNGTSFMTLALTELVGGVSRHLNVVSVAPSDGALGTQTSITPQENFVDANAFGAAFGASRIFVIGEDSDDQSGNVVCQVLDSAGANLTTPLGLIVAPGFGAEVAFNATSLRFAVAYQDANGISAKIYGADGTLASGPIVISADTSADLVGLCASGTSAEFLVTFTETTASQLHAIRLNANDGSLGGDIIVESTVDAGVCCFDPLGGNYLIAHGATGSRMVSALAAGSDSLGAVGALPIARAPNVASAGNLGGVFADQTTIPTLGAANTFIGAHSAGGTPLAGSVPLAPQTGGDLPLSFNGSARRLAIAGDASGRFLVVGRDGTNGVTAVILQMGPTNE